MKPLWEMANSVRAKTEVNYLPQEEIEVIELPAGEVEVIEVSGAASVTSSATIEVAVKTGRESRRSTTFYLDSTMLVNHQGVRGSGRVVHARADRLLGHALGWLPHGERERCAEEWRADLLELAGDDRGQWKHALGLLWSALALRRDSRRSAHASRRSADTSRQGQ